MFRIFLLAALSLGLPGAAAPPREPALERSVLAELNFARAHPRQYAARLRAYRALFTGKVVRYPGNSTGLQTAEGVNAVDEAIAFLQQQRPLPPFEHSDLLQRAAGEHVVEQGPRGATGHKSRNGERADARVWRQGGGGHVAETITYGPPSAVEVVRQLIVDDDVPDRGHRRVVYSEEFGFAGVRCGPHKRYGKMCVAVFGRTEDGR